MASENYRLQILESPLSFTGSAKRTSRALWSNRGALFRALAGWWLHPFVLLSWWFLVGAWYLTFGIFVIPFRIARRNRLARERQAGMHEELLEATRAASSAGERDSVQCPFCAEEILEAAIKCKHCGSALYE